MTAHIEEPFAVVDVLGRRLRERRRELGLTLAEVAAVADISVGHSSAIEKGTTVPSLPVLARVAHALGLTLAEVLRASPGPRITHGHVDAAPGAERLTPGVSRVQIVYAHAAAGESAGPPFPLSGADVFVFVHEGAIAIEVDEDRHELATGDSIHCQAPRSIAWSASGGPAGTLWVARAPRVRPT